MTRRLAATGRADLVRAFGAQGDAGLQSLAEILGLEREKGQQPDFSTAQSSVSASFAESKVHEFKSIPFLRVGKVEYAEAREMPRVAQPKSLELDPEPTEAKPEISPLVAWPRLRRVLEEIFQTPRRSEKLDVVKLVHQLARGQVIRRLPRRFVTGLGTIRVFFDRSLRLAPFFEDQQKLVGGLVQVFGAKALKFEWSAHGPTFLSAAKGPVLVVSDLGFLAGGAAVEAWAEAGKRLIRGGAKLLALLPCPRNRWQARVARLWNAVEWENPALEAVAALPAAAETLGEARDLVLQLLQPATRVEPGLLRDVRRVLGRDADAGTEADVWSMFDRVTHVASSPGPQLRELLRGRPPALDYLRRAAFEEIRKWHRHCPPLIGAQEAQAPEADEADRARGREYLKAALAEVRQRNSAEVPFLVEWLKDLSAQLTANELDSDLERELMVTWAVLQKQNPQLPLPKWVSPALLAELDPDLGLRHFSIVQLGNRIVFQPFRAEPPAAGSVLGEIQASSSRIVVVGAGPGSIEIPVQAPFSSFDLEELPPVLRVVSNLEVVELWTETRPAWASAAGRDGYGLWADLKVGGVVQRMRYIRPGRFLMGSPETEEGRWPDEGPQHQVTLTEGFWLADTPCTQEFWQVVMGENPSYFKGAKRPVEQVSWDDVQLFLVKLGQGLTGGDMVPRLPTEAQWEYACRAGTQTSTYAGGAEIVRNEIAWYNANSSSETHDVAQKLANLWGLFDTLGNVLEWCADFWSGNYDGASGVDQEGPVMGSYRVYRGGSWSHHAGYVRAAYRYGYGPGFHNDGLGFRFSLGRPRSGEGAERGKGLAGAVRRSSGSGAPS